VVAKKAGQTLRKELVSNRTERRHEGVSSIQGSLTGVRENPLFFVLLYLLVRLKLLNDS